MTDRERELTAALSEAIDELIVVADWIKYVPSYEADTMEERVAKLTKKLIRVAAKDGGLIHGSVLRVGH